ncbi:MAG: Gfo/Idh/MocA family oxidoreductase, partial [SAR324 cluster bacterium]|nr:Gfo/Idh/MocA family oxidoreductase [SAR324 cluster bacterium]
MTIEAHETSPNFRRIPYGMVGGGEGAFIGAVHRIAARIDDRFELVAGALSSEAERSKRSGQAIGIASDRCYGSYHEMAQQEAARPDGIEAVVIVTPNHLHVPIAKAFLEAGIHVICDKPLAAHLADTEGLSELVKEQDRLFAVTYNYSGYPLIRHAREIIASGELGKIRVVQAEYPQDWLSEKLEDTGQKQASWRTDPNQAGGGGCLGDIGTHAFHLACFVSGLTPASVLADLNSFVDGRQLDDNVHVLLRFEGGAKGMLWASQVAPGNENGLRLRIYGDKAGLSWSQENPNYLTFSPLGEPSRLLGRGGPGLTGAAERVTRIPPGHPEGYLEGFATIYREVADSIEAKRNGKDQPDEVTFPDLEEGLQGMR